MRPHRWSDLSTVLIVGLALLGLLLFAAGRLSAEEPGWKVGLAKAKITPEEPIWLAGYGGRDRPAEGTLHDLWIKALALEAADGRRAVVVTSDLLGFPRNMSERITAELQTRCGLDRSQVMLTASHSHSAPVLRDALYDIYPLDDKQRALIDAYSDEVEKKVVQIAVEAMASRAPAMLWAGEGTAGFAVNRRNNREAEVRGMIVEGKPLAGPVDHDVPVLAVRAPEGSLRAVVFGYACHATTLAFYQVSGDYPGFAQIALEADNPGALAMFCAGCGADQNPLPRRSVALCGKYGFTLADAVEVVLQAPMRAIVPTLQTAFETLQLDFEKPLSREDLQAALAKGSFYARRAERLLKELDAGGQFATSYPYPVQVWKLGEDRLWIALGGEVVVDYALRFKSTYGPRTWVTGYANDVMAYIPSRRIWEEGGYESGAFYVYGLPADRWNGDIEERIAGCVQRLVEKLQ